MGDTVSGLIELLSSESSARVILVTIIVLVVLFALVFALMIGLFKAVKTIKKESREEYNDEQKMLEYQKKVDATTKDIEYITDLLIRLTETVNVSNTERKSEMDSLRNLVTSESGCMYGHNVSQELASLRDEVLKSIKDDVALLLESDRESIKSYITSEYHKWMRRGYIDMYTLRALDEQFEKYKREHGNTFVKGMMTELHNSLEIRCITKNCQTEHMKLERDQVQIIPAKHAPETGSEEKLNEETIQQ